MNRLNGHRARFTAVICDANHPRKTERPQKRAVLIRKSKIFIKAKLTVSKSCLLGPTSFMIYCILSDAHLQNLSFLRRLSTEFIFSNFSYIATYPRRLGNQNQKLSIFQKLLTVAMATKCLTIQSNTACTVKHFIWLSNSAL